jgi:glutathione synthase/RimK-type ligase-like ATP-grasp enzyme
VILIVTATKDLHALVIQSKLRAEGFRDAHIIECDRIAQRAFLTYGIAYDVKDEVLTSEGEAISLSKATLLWLRRTRANQILEAHVADEAAREIINNDCRGGLTGFLSTHFKGKWISTPEATYRSSDKIFQLNAAHQCGFRIPRTLVSQSRSQILEFFEACAGNMIVKTIVGAPQPFLQTVKISNLRSLDEASFNASPAIFQEYIAGSEHLRLNCFGDSSYAALIRSADVDWRGNLNVPITPYNVPDVLHRKVRRVLDYLQLEMGIVDLKLTPEGEPVWLEVNPQGQFVFLDPLTNMDLAGRFADYLLAEQRAAEAAMG